MFPLLYQTFGKCFHNFGAILLKGTSTSWYATFACTFFGLLFTYCPTASGFWRSSPSHVLSQRWYGPSLKQYMEASHVKSLRTTSLPTCIASADKLEEEKEARENVKGPVSRVSTDTIGRYSTERWSTCSSTWSRSSPSVDEQALPPPWHIPITGLWQWWYLHWNTIFFCPN